MALTAALAMGGRFAGAEIVENTAFTGAKTTIRYSLWGGADEVSDARQFCQSFVKLHPEIRLDVNVYPWGQYWAKVQTQMASGLAPDVMGFYSGAFGVWVARGALMPLDDLAKTAGLKLSDYYPVAIQTSSWNGHLYSLPTDIANWCLVYSTDRLQESGIPKSEWPSKDTPMTWDQFLSLSKRLTLRNPDGTMAQYGMTAGQNWDLSMSGMDGGDFMDKAVDPTRATAKGNEPLIQALIKVYQNQYGDRTTLGNVPLSNGAFSVNSDTVLLTPKFAMGTTGPWALKQLVDGGAHFGIAPLPREAKDHTLISVNSLGMYAQTKHPKEAFEFMSYVAGPVVEPSVGLKLKGVPALMSARDSLVHNQYGIPDCEAYIHDLEVSTPATTTQSTDITNARDNWLVHIENSMKDEYDSRLQALPKTNGRVSAADYQAFVSGMNSFVEKTIRDQIGDVDSQMTLAFDQQKPFPSSPLVKTVLPIVSVLLLAVGLVWYVRSVGQARNEAKEEGKSNKLGYLFIAPWLFGLVCFILGPIVAAVILSFTEWNMISPPSWVGFQHYVQMPQDTKFLIGVKNTFLYALLVIPISLGGGLFTAGLLTARIKGADLFKAIIYFPALFTGAETAVLWTNMLNKDHGVLNYILGFVHIAPIDWMDAKHAFFSVILMNVFWIGGAMIIYYAGMKQIPAALYEAAELDGASMARKFIKITIPMLSPVILFMVVMTTIGSFQVFTPALFFADNSTSIGSPDDALRFYAVNIYDQAFNNLRMGEACSYAIILFLIIFAITLIQLKVANRFVHTENVG